MVSWDAIDEILEQRYMQVSAKREDSAGTLPIKTMIRKILDNREKLLDISLRKTEVLQSTIENIEDILSNDIFVEEIQEVFMELVEEESQLIVEKEMTVECPGCMFECAQIHNYCMACGTKLTPDREMGDL